MKALVSLGPAKKALEEHPKPEIMAPTDVIVKITKTTICGTDLHLLKGDVPSCQSGRILGHEGVGIVDKAGPDVTAFKPGDRVLISCISACGKCNYCRKLMYSHCTTGAWILGNRIDGTQAEFVRIPYGDTSLYPIPDGADEEALVMLSDILPTGFECGVLNGDDKPKMDPNMKMDPKTDDKPKMDPNMNMDGKDPHAGHGGENKTVPGFPQSLGGMEMYSSKEIEKLNSRWQAKGMRKGWFDGVERLMTVVRVLPPELYDRVVSGNEKCRLAPARTPGLNGTTEALGSGANWGLK